MDRRRPAMRIDRFRPAVPTNLVAVARLYAWQRRLTSLLGALGAVPRPFVLTSALLIIVLLGVADFLTGPFLSLSVFYLLPILVTSWVAGRSAGYVVASAAVAVWLTADVLGPIAELSSPIPYWNAAALLALFLLTVFLVSALRMTVSYENELLAEVQQRLLPTDLPTIQGCDLAGYWRPAGVVGGDYFDVFQATRTEFALCIGDVSGKGVAAAMVMSNLQAAVHAMADERETPARLCRRVNHVLSGNIRASSFVSFFCTIDAAAYRLVYANAGHVQPLLIRKDGGCQRLTIGGPVLGVFAAPDYEEAEVELRPGDRLILCTDAIPERENALGEEFGEERLIAAAIRHRHLAAAGLRDALVRDVETFGNGPFDDDLTLLVAAVGPEQPTS